MVDLKMEEATKKLMDGHYKKAAMAFSKVSCATSCLNTVFNWRCCYAQVIELDPGHVEAQSGLREAHKGVWISMSANHVCSRSSISVQVSNFL